MSLHLATEPDWQAVKPAERNRWQRLAATTGGYLTLGNLITVIGFVLVLAGFVSLLRHRPLLSVVLIAAGRAADLLDGYIADVTRTKSPLGEAVDAGFDKLELLLAIIVLFITPYVSNILAVLLLLHLMTSGLLFFVASKRGIRMHPTRAGKLSAATAWLSVGLFVLQKADLAHGLAVLVHAAAVIGAVIFVLLAVISIGQYIRQVRNR